MPTPVGPAPRDPNDPDFWDWGPPSGDRDDEVDWGPRRQRRVARAVIAALLVLALLLVTLRLILG